MLKNLLLTLGILISTNAFADFIKPVVVSGGLGCDDDQCIWVVGQNLKDDAYVDVRPINNPDQPTSYVGSSRSFQRDANGSAIITLRLKLQDVRYLDRDGGLNIWLVNPGETWSEPFRISGHPKNPPPPTPTPRPRGEDTTTLGFNFFVPGAYSTWVSDPWKSTKVQNLAERDLAIMAAMGTKVVRIFILAGESGWKLSSKTCTNVAAGCAGGVFDTKKMDAIVQNLVAPNGVLALLSKYKIKAIVNFWQLTYLWHFTGTDLPWKKPYGNSPAGWEKFISDNAFWVNRIASQVEKTDMGKKNVLYFDLSNEIGAFTGIQFNNSLLRKLLTGVEIADERRGLSINSPCDLGDYFLTDIQVTRKPLAFVDTHAYPSDFVNVGCGTDDLHYGDKLSILTSVYPQATLIAGEYAAAMKALDSGWHKTQRTEEEHARLDLAAFNGPNSATSAGAMAALRWVLWDRGPEGWGLGDSSLVPRDTFGRYTDQSIVNQIPSGGDFEKASSEDNWSVSSGAKLERVGPSNSDAATGDYFLRLTGLNGAMACSQSIDVRGKSGLALTAYVRGTTSQLKAVLHFPGTSLRDETQSLKLSSSSSKFSNIQALTTRGFTFSIPASASDASICFQIVGVGTKNQYRLDFDTVSAHSF